MPDFKVALFSDPPVASWAMSELMKAGFPLACAVTALPRLARFDAAEQLRKIANGYGIPFFRQTSLHEPDFAQIISKTNPVVIVAISFLKKIPEELIRLAPHGGLNVHPSLLPRYRGAVPYFWAIYKRESVSGVTVHEMTQKFDAGDIHFQEEIPLDPGDTTGTLSIKCFSIGIKLLIQALQCLKDGKTLPRIPQDPKEATHAPVPDQSVLEIKWNKEAAEILALIRAGSPFLGAFTFFRKLQLRIWSARISRPNSENIPPGTMITSHGRLETAANDQLISLEALQLEMLRFYSGSEFLMIPEIKDGEMLGRST